jgi:hypothetical protein
LPVVVVVAPNDINRILQASPVSALFFQGFLLQRFVVTTTTTTTITLV